VAPDAPPNALPHADLVLRGASRLVTLAPDRVLGANGPLGVIRDGTLAACDGRILWCGPAGDLDAYVDTTDAVLVDAAGHAVIPGFVDSHTHFVFAGDRAEEFQLRHAGITYEQLAQQGLGILSTVAATRAASFADLVTAGRARLASFASHGTTTVEGKTGYGLSLDAERTCLEVMAELAHKPGQPTVVSTFLGAHTLPREFRATPGDRGRYVDLVTDEMLPAFASMARFCDVFCEETAFSVDEACRILEHAARLGYKLKLHANQLGPSGGARLAAKLGAVSADHLDFATDGELDALAAAGVVGTLLPGCSFSLNTPYPSGQRLLEHGVRLALATDFNPGTSYCESMQMVIALAVSAMGLTLDEALSAATLGGAAALGLADEVGSLESGKWCDLAILRGPDERELAYHFGVNLVERTLVRGQEAIHAAAAV
jgi:imidazolonepropionase